MIRTRREILVTLALVLLLLGATALAYRPALGSGFLNWDDPDTVTDNVHVAGGGLSGLGHILTGRVFSTWLPVYFGSLWLDHAIFGPDPLAFHLVNLILHVLNALLVLLIARRLGARAEVAWGAAFLFALHPAAVQSVAWISERKGLLAFLFAALAFLAFCRASEKTGARRARAHAGGAGMLALALLAKGSALALPLLLLLYVVALRWPERRARWWLDLSPYFAVALVLAAVHLAIARDEGTALSAGGPGLGALLLTNVPVLARYLRLLVLPFWGQSAVHAMPVETGFSVGVALGVIGIGAFLAALQVAWRKDRAIFFALGAAALALAPFNNVFPRTTVLFAERYLYLPLLGGALAIALLLGRILAGRGALRLRAAFAGLVLVFGVLLGFRAWTWRDPVPLFADAVEKSGGVWLAEMKLGEAHADATRGERDWGRAAKAFRRAAESAETALDETRARANLSGVLLALGGREEEVLEEVAAARARFGELGEDEREALTFHLEVNRGSALSGLGRPEEAADAYRAAARARPGDPAPLIALVGALLAAGNPSEALEAGNEAVRLAPENETAVVVLAQTMLATGDVAGSRRTLETLVERRPDSAAALAFLGRIELASSRPRAARERFAAALEARPDLTSARRGMAEADLLTARSLYAAGKREEARELAVRSVDADPENADAVTFLGAVTDDANRADEILARAARMPGGERARDLLATHRILHALARLDAGDEGAAADLVLRALSAKAAFLSGAADLRIRGDLPMLLALRAEGAAGRHEALLGIALALGGRAEPAEERLANAISRAEAADEFDGPVVWSALFARGRLRLEGGDWRGARDDFAILLDTHAADPLAAEGKAEALYFGAAEARAAGRDSDEDFATARAAAERALEIAPESLSAKLTLGRIEFATGDTVNSLRRFREAKRENPGRSEPMVGLAGLYQVHFQLTGDKTYLQAARAELEEAVEMDPHDARARAELGRVLVQTGDAAEASRQLQLAIAEDPTLTSARESLADLYVRAARAQFEQGGPEGRDRAKDLVQRALALRVRRAAPHLFQAELLRADRDFAPAQAELEQAHLLEPESAEVKDALASFHKDLGYALLLRGERKRAIEAFERALAAGSEGVDLDPVRQFLAGGSREDAPETDPEVARILAEKAEVARVAFDEAGEKLEAGDLDGAVESALRSLAAFSTGEGWYRLGRIREARKEREGAALAYRNAVREKPSLAVAWLGLGNVQYRLGEWADALTAYESFLAVAGDDVPEATRFRIEETIKELRTTIDEDGK